MSASPPLPAGVRAARPSDAPALAHIYVDVWRATYAGLVPDQVLVGMSYERQAAQWERVIAARAGHRRREAVLVAERPDGGVAGLASCGRCRRPDFGFAGEIFTLYVDQDRQNAGHGAALLRGCFATLAGDGLGSALVWVLVGNPARFFYRAMGGRHVADRREPLWGTLIEEEGYGWPDLEAALAPDGGRRPGAEG